MVFIEIFKVIHIFKNTQTNDELKKIITQKVENIINKEINKNA